MAFDKNYDQLIKVLLTGDSSVGKTSLICQFVDNDVRQTHIATIGIDFKMKLFEVNDQRVKLQIWDTAGQERFETLSVQYYRRAQAILLVYDVTNENSFKNVTKWIRNIKENALDNVKVVLVGNKVDLEQQRVISTEKGQKLAERHSCKFFETSAFTGVGVKEAFTSLAELVLSEKKSGDEHFRDNRAKSFVLKKSDKKEEPKNKSSGCC
jgi:small GTP-binding protein